MPDEDVNRRLRLDAVLEARPDLARKILDDPSATLSELGATESDLACPDFAHEALDRVAPAAEELTRRGSELSLGEALKAVPEVVGPALGEDFMVQKVPFGMRFSERGETDITATSLTAKGSVECTLGMKCGPDVGVDF